MRTKPHAPRRNKDKEIVILKQSLNAELAFRSKREFAHAEERERLRVSCAVLAGLVDKAFEELRMARDSATKSIQEYEALRCMCREWWR
jgi:hypothetical protein